MVKTNSKLNSLISNVFYCFSEQDVDFIGNTGIDLHIALTLKTIKQQRVYIDSS